MKEKTIRGNESKIPVSEMLASVVAIWRLSFKSGLTLRFVKHVKHMTITTYMPQKKLK